MKLFLALLLAGALATTAAMVVLQPNEGGTLQCNGDELLIERASLTEAIYNCIAYTPTPEATATVAPTATPEHDMADMHWHAPGAHGDRPYHEHGDAVPQWVTAAGYDPSYSHVGGTPGENHAYYKHTGFKGWAGRFNNVDWYGVFHLDFNPGGHSGRFHSYQLWLRDQTGAVSHLHGWLDFGFNINPNYFAGGDPTNPATWTSRDGEGWHNLNRRVEFAWYANRSTQRGDFWTTQFGNVVSGPNDAACGTTATVGEKSYTVACLKQTIQPTLPSIQFPGNSVQREFAEGDGVLLLPN